ncbi:hypothetical protein EJB05_18884, partial [Eragrostis curvula]
MLFDGMPRRFNTPSDSITAAHLDSSAMKSIHLRIASSVSQSSDGFVLPCGSVDDASEAS